MGRDRRGRLDLGPAELGIVWSPWDWVSAEYKYIEGYVVQAITPKMTVSVRGWPKYKALHNDLMVDGVSLVRVDVGNGGDPPDPPIDPPTGGDHDEAYWSTMRSLLRSEMPKGASIEGTVTLS